MYALLILLASFLFLSWSLVKLLFDYFRDAKGLRKYPNYNLLCGISNIGWCIEAWRGGIRSKSLKEMHKVHRVIRIGPNSLSYGDVRALKDIYGHGTKCAKDPFYQTEISTHFNIGNVINKKGHARKRNMLAGAFSLRSMENWEFKIAGKVSQFITACDGHCTTPLPEGSVRPNPKDLKFDWRAWTKFFTIDAICDMAVSEHTGLLESGNDLMTIESPNGNLEQVRFCQCLHASKTSHTRIAYATKWYRFNSKFTTHLLPSYRKFWKLAGCCGNIVHHMTKKRLNRVISGEKLDDIFNVLMEEKNGNPRNLEWGEIVAEMGVILDAGSATTAIALNNVIFWLLRNPRCLAHLREEVDNALDFEDVVAPYKKVRNLPYLRACLDGSLRITPPFSYNLPRETPVEGAVIFGEFVPGQTSVSMSSYVAHRDEEVFPDAEKFIPERWLGEKNQALQPYFVPFSAGARGCIGRNVSYMEQTILIASVIHRYEFSLPHPEWDQERVEVTNLLPGPIPLKVWMRDLVDF